MATRHKKTKTDYLQDIWPKYVAAGMPTPASKHDVAKWAIDAGEWRPHPTSIIAQCADDLAKAWRADFRVDEKGRKYRTKYPVMTVTSGVQLTLWADIERAPFSHLEKSLAQRRRKFTAMVFQAKTDTDVVNEKHPNQPPIQMVLDFGPDVSELEALRDSESEFNETA